MKTYFNNIKVYALRHKAISIIILIAIFGIGYWGYGKLTSTSGDIRYVTSKVQQATIIASVSGSGQVSASNQVDIKPKSSGTVVYVYAKNGQKVSTGALIAQLDTTDASKSVRDAEINLQSAKLSLQKLQVQNSNENLSADLLKAYDDGFSSVSDTFLDLQTTLNGLDNIFNNQYLTDNSARSHGQTALDYRTAAQTAYYTAKTAFDKNNTDYHAVNSGSPKSDVENIIEETYQTTKLLSDAIKNTANFTNYMAESSSSPATFTTTQNTLSGYTNTINGHLSSLSAAGANIKNNKDTSQNSGLNIQSAELTVKQKENALQDAKDNLANYFIRAPFDGTLSIINIKKSDSISPSTNVVTLVTQKQIAEISLNEVDVAKIKVGQKSTLTFGAIPDLTISGVVGEIDTIGTVSQGVVTYNVKISFDTQDERVKPGMSVSAAIITDMKQDVLVVSNSAIKSQGGTSYVEEFDSPLTPPTDGLIGSISKITPNKIPVVVGISNGSQSEILSGLNLGDQIVTRTITPSTATAATAPSLFGGAGGTRGATTGGAVRATGARAN